MNERNNQPDNEVEDDPRNVFLDATAVIQRYHWGKTRGYQNLKDRDLMPPPVMTHPNRWRLDQLLRWEELRIAQAERALIKSAEASPPQSLASMLPPPKRRRGNQSA